MEKAMRVLLGVLTVGVLLTGAACGSGSDGPDVASANAGPVAATPSATVTAGDRSEQLRQFAQCMRDHGVAMNDPQPGQAGGGLGGLAAGLDPNDPTVRAAFTACQSNLPNGGQPPKLDAQQAAAYRVFAQCMRDHGIDLPDPAADGTLQLNGSMVGMLQDPAARAAFTACQGALAGLRPSASGTPQ
jgi:hypothetical protein